MSEERSFVGQMSHDDLAHNLALHLLHKDRMVFEDLPCGSAGSQRPDVLVMSKSYTKPNPIAYEIKVSVSDFRSDVTSAKWRGYLKYAWGVSFAVPKGLITKTDLPDGCGLVTYNGEGWSTVKRPTLSPCPLDTEFMLKLLIDGQRRQTTPEPLKNRGFDRYACDAALRKKWGKDIAAKLHFLDEYPAKKRELKALEKRLCDALDLNPASWNTSSNIAYRIQKLEALASEDERAKKLAKDLVRLRSEVNRQFGRHIENLGGEI